MAILLELFEIIALKRKPQDISFDTVSAITAFVAAVAVSYFSVGAANVTTQPLPFVLSQALTQAIIFYILLSITGKQNRFTQTITALFGVSAILQMIGLVTLVLPGLEFLGLFITGWNLYLMIIILREAIECSTLQSVGITILYHFVIGVVLYTLFPEIFEQMQSLMQPPAAS